MLLCSNIFIKQIRKFVLPATCFLVFHSLLMAQTSLPKLTSQKDFSDFSGLPLTEKYEQVTSIKVVYDIMSKNLYYINSKHFRYHHEFCAQEFNNDLDLESFNNLNYSNDPNRKFLLGNINYYKTLDFYALELSPVDLMTTENILLFWKNITSTTFIGNKLKLLINSSRLLTESESLSNLIPLLSPSEIYKNINYQAISKHNACGVLHFIRDLDEEKNGISPMDILVLNNTPLSLPTVSGVIINEFQTPLSHLTILGQNRNIPIAAYKKAFSDSSLIKLDQHKVCFTVSTDTFSLKPINKLSNSKKKIKAIQVKYDLQADSLIDVSGLTKKSYLYTGHKAGNFGLLYQLSKKNKFLVPEGAFVIPFYFYQQHILRSNAKTLIPYLLNHQNELKSNDSIKQILRAIRNTINTTPIDSSLIAAIETKVKKHPEFTNLRFRSSTNAEDAEGFSGAGLYTSKTGILNDKTESFEKAIKNVWASLWTYEAFTEREYYRIDHRRVFMGILVHRSFPNEDVNGVAITKNLYRPDN